MPNRKKWIRYVLYAIESLLLFLLQDTPGLLPQIMGVKPLPVLSAALTIAMVEACTPAMAFGMYAGFLADIGSGAVFGYHALTFGVLCFLLSGLCGTVITAGAANTHQCTTSIAHNRLYVCKVEVNQTVLSNELRNTLNALTQYVIGYFECFQ